MIIKCLGSSSQGNCYILENESEALIIECGIDYKYVQQSLNFNLSKIAGVLFSHSHNDHSGFVSKFVANGINVYSSEEALLKKGLLGKPFTKSLNPLMRYKIGNYTIIPFDLLHDVRCYGYYIEHNDFGNLVFVTDTHSIANQDGIYYDFGKINTYMVEANFSDEELIKNIESGRVPKELRIRLLNSHLNIETLKDYFLNVDMSHTHKIILLHLSDGNSDEKLFVQSIQQQTGIPTYAAKKGLRLAL